MSADDFPQMQQKQPMNQAMRFAVGDRDVAADEIVRQLDDHANPAEPAALDE